ncbi:peptidoglycan-binding protein [Jannaschia sp. Os4]|uniref:holin-associated N-acetylmuramidase n=1 Tax=Jannaschia sp. Os4 TaxID=2807617 RepID=UPI00193A7D75|nr:holin-associated N-acetylmuramidase [Jannaschia sp. Os4]MBM2577751.1 peptidoglycan-binding protein [Jannaschia sp. Os4]
MQTVRQIAEAIVAREGGFVDDPDDPGGATKHGVTIHTARRLGLDLDGDGDVDADDVRRITPAQAADVYVRDYFQKPGIGRLPSVLWAQVFDMQVNAGSNAVRILQRLLGRMGHPVAVDGAIGPRTEAAAEAAASEAPAHIADAYAIARREWYYRLAQRRPALRKFAKRRDGGKGGWIARAEEFMAARYRLSDAEHRTRTKGWA